MEVKLKIENGGYEIVLKQKSGRRARIMLSKTQYFNLINRLDQEATYDTATGNLIILKN